MVDYLLPVPAQTPVVRQIDGLGVFEVPPLDGSLSVPEIYDWHYEHNPKFPIFQYLNDERVPVKITYSEVVPAVHRAGRLVGSYVDKNETPRPMFAILSSVDTVSYFCTVLGLLRADIPALPLSPRNSPAAIAHLLKQVRATHILIGNEPSLLRLLHDVREMAPELDVRLCRMPLYDELFVNIGDAQAPFEMLPVLSAEREKTILYVHSSGSTSFPKPIPWNAIRMLQGALSSAFTHKNLCGEIFGCHAIAMSHSMGLSHISWVAGSGFIMGIFQPTFPPTLPSPDRVFEEFMSSGISYAFSVPSIIEMWSRDTSKMEYLKTLKGVIYGGGPLPAYAGKTMMANGVIVINTYGATECGMISGFLPESADWEHFSLNPHCAASFVPFAPGLFRLVLVKKPTQWLAFINTKFNGQDAYDTSDILQPHPTIPGQWKIYGRADDQIMHSNGEKTNPLPLEAILAQHPLVEAALIFGRSRFYAGALIQVRKVEGEEWALRAATDKATLDRFKDTVWPKVEEANTFAPAHSRLLREMIIVASPNKPFTFTGKGTLRRIPILKDYEDEINSLYDTQESYASSSTNFDIPAEWTSDSCTKFIETVVRSMFPSAALDDDLFDKGADSLHAMTIYRTILKALSTLFQDKLSLDTIHANIVYEQPTIRLLSTYIFSVTSDLESRNDADPLQRNVNEMKALVEHYSQFSLYEQPRTTVPSAKYEGDVILVTGTTGALGANVLAKLYQMSNVALIFAFNRKSTPTHTLLSRQQAALISQGYDPTPIVSSSKVILVEGTLDEQGFGIDEALLNRMHAAVTHIIHIAWYVNFNVPLKTFKPSIGGVRTLVNFALSSPQVETPRLVFVSSRGALRNISLTSIFPEVPVNDPRISASQGYGESKWVAESTLYRAAEITSLRPVVVRAGQLAGNRSNGAWTISDWLPALVISSVTLGQLPFINGNVSWIPVDAAAEALIDMRNSSLNTLHLVHPRPVPCGQLFDNIASKLHLACIPYETWLSRLEQFSSNKSISESELYRKLPALKLLDFFRAVQNREAQIDSSSQSIEAFGLPGLAFDHALEVSQTLRTLPPLSGVDVENWLTYWHLV